MGYVRRYPTFDNSAVSTRQVRRQRERLAKKGLTDNPPLNLLGRRFTSSAYLPHDGGGRFSTDRGGRRW